MTSIRLLLLWLLVTTGATASGFFVGGSALGRSIFASLGGEGYDGWEAMLTSVVGGGLGFLLGAIVATIVVVKQLPPSSGA